MSRLLPLAVALLLSPSAAWAQSGAPVSAAEADTTATRTVAPANAFFFHDLPGSDQYVGPLDVLLNKGFIPKDMIWKLYESEYFKENPEPLVAFAQAANLVKMAGVFAEMTKNGEMTPLLIKRWVNPRSLVTM